MSESAFIHSLTPEIEERIERNPLLNIDTFIIPSPFVKDADIEKDYEHSYVWLDEGEMLGYILVYSDAAKRHFHIYKIVTSPFGRGKGIGTSFIEHLTDQASPGSSLYLYVWDKQIDTIEFFRKKGFVLGDTIVYRNLLFYHMHAAKEDIRRRTAGGKGALKSVTEEIGKARHDARKTVHLLSSMIETLSPENCNRIIEDINRETTTLINMLNALRDSVEVIHGVNLQNLILERLVPYVEASRVACEVRLVMDAPNPVILGYYVNIGRALVNMVSNSLDAIEEAKRKGIIEIGLREQEGRIVIAVSDNGIGLTEEQLILDEDGIPAFVGRTTKGRDTGEGMGTQQIYSTFGPENITVTSIPYEGTSWRITCEKAGELFDKTYVRLERRFNEFKDLWEKRDPSVGKDRTTIISYIWQVRAMEIFLFDVILEFSAYHNIRTIYRKIFLYLRGFSDEPALRKEVSALRSNHERLRDWLFETAREIRGRLERLERGVNLDDFRGAMFKSYGQAPDNLIIFTMDPDTGSFLATDRKLAEHADFVQFLEKDRDHLLRGEFKGDVNDDSKPIYLGVWSVSSGEDALAKLGLIRRGVEKLLDMGLHPAKRLSFYQTTYVSGDTDIDGYKSTTLGEMAAMNDADLGIFVRKADDEIQSFVVID